MPKKILIFDIGPVFKDYVHGGAEKILREVSIHLGSKGHKVDIFCARREDNNKPFELAKNVSVYPVLKFKQTFPNSYKTSPYNLWSIIKILREEMGKHDVFYSHGSGLNFAMLYNQKIPTVVSLRDFVYPETLVGAFNFQRDIMIVNSATVKESVLHSIGNFLPGLEKRIRLVPNGINLEKFKKTKPESILRLFKQKLTCDNPIVLFPHRPEISKGILESFEIISRLKHKHKMTNIRLMVPEYMDRKLSIEVEEYYKNLIRIIKEKDIEENVIFHEWIPFELMPEYYSLGSLTLVIGNFIEAFGSNVTIESLACGTPVIVSKVGANKTTIPDGLIPKVAYGDIDEIEKISLKFLKDRTKHFEENKIRSFLEKNFSFLKMLDSYEQIICGAKISPPLHFRIKEKPIKKMKFKIAPWCCLTKLGLYSDYDYCYQKIKENLKNLLQKEKVVDLNIAKRYNCKEEFLQLVNNGLLVEY